MRSELSEHFFGQLTQKRWEIAHAAQGKGELSVRELARAVGRDVKRVHEDVGVLTHLGLLERTESQAPNPGRFVQTAREAQAGPDCVTLFVAIPLARQLK